VLTAAAAMLAGSAQARSSAKPARGAVHSSCRRVTHPRRGARACVQSRRRAKPHQRSGAAVKHTAGAPQPSGAAAPSAGSAPACEGAAAVRQHDGSFACTDDSEPGCVEGLAPVLSVLYCSASSEGGSGGCEGTSCPSGEAGGALCEDGSAPARTPAGGFSCADGSEPACFDGASPTSSPNATTLVCPTPPAAEEDS
jgi:hypothetical protein